MSNVTIAFNGDCEAPKYATDGSAGCDLIANEDGTVPAGERVLVSTGLFVAIPRGFEGQVRPRSGLAYKNGVTVLNTPGTIDSDYRGEVKVILFNHGTGPFYFKKGDRIAQLVIMPVMRASFVRMEQLSSTERGEGGFGSTGK